MNRFYALIFPMVFMATLVLPMSASGNLCVDFLPSHSSIQWRNLELRYIKAAKFLLHGRLTLTPDILTEVMTRPGTRAFYERMGFDIELLIASHDLALNQARALIPRIQPSL